MNSEQKVKKEAIEKVEKRRPEASGAVFYIIKSND